VPHSLGILKKGNVSKEKWTELRIDERIETEIRLIAALDGIVATSSTIRQTLLDDYAYQGPDLFLPPCVDPDRYYPRQVKRDAPIWSFLSERSGLSSEEVSSQTIITEISRTDTTKRKDVLIRAFARVLDQHPDCLLVISIDDRRANQASRLKRLIQDLDIESRVAVVGSIWDILPDLYAVTDIYCTPSVMEGFGMSAQEAAASGVPVVSSDLVPFVEEYLLGNSPGIVQRVGKKDPLRLGEAAIVVPADDIEGFVMALRILLEDPSLRQQMGENAFRITVPYFTWSNRVKLFMEQIESNNNE
jgi:glycosyltransferase involved in cell wall biosynthesis